MRRRRPVVVAVTLATAVSGMLAAGAATTTTRSTARPSASAIAAAFPNGQQRGMILGNVNRPPSLVARDLARMQLDGINTVSIYIYLQTPSPTSTTVAPYALTPTDTELRLVATMARQLGMHIAFQPVLETPSYVWRGEFHPSDVNAFFASWTQRVVHYADLAQSVGASMFYIGSENDSLVKYATQWRRLATTVRHHYSGVISYMTTALRVRAVTWWDALDAVALSPYFALSLSPEPSYNELISAWKRVHLRYLASLYRSYRKPIVFAEIGYRSVVGGVTHPYSSKVKGAPSMTLQADAYRALLDAVASAPYIKGVTWFFWSPTALPLATDFTPQNKYAECVLAKYWSQLPLSSLGRTLNCQPGVG